MADMSLLAPGQRRHRNKSDFPLGCLPSTVLLKRTVLSTSFARLSLVSDESWLSCTATVYTQ